MAKCEECGVHGLQGHLFGCDAAAIVEWRVTAVFVVAAHDEHDARAQARRALAAGGIFDASIAGVAAA